MGAEAPLLQSSRVRPRLRGAFHEWAFYAAVPLGVALGFAGDGGRPALSAAIFAASVVAMFGCSALYHRVNWSPSRRLWLRRLDHAGIYGLIAGTYTPFGLLVFSGAWRVTVLAIVWGGALLAIALKFAWVSAPKWLAALIGVALGWVGVVVFPQLIARAGLTVAMLCLAGGLLYTAGAVVYALGRPDPRPEVFGYHEVFHVMVVAAVALQYAAVALVVT